MDPWNYNNQNKIDADNRAFQTQQAINHVAATIAAEKEVDRIHTLKMEIIKAEDPRVRMELQGMLDEILEARRKRNRWMMIGSVIAVAVVIVGGLAIYGSIGETTPNDNNRPTNLAVKESSSEENTRQTNDKVKKENIDTTKLSTPQIKAWVSAIMDKKLGPDTKTKYYLTLEKQDDDLVYVRVNPTIQTDTLDYFRINSNGELEESGYYQGKADTWIVVSKKYLDTSMIIPYKKNSDEMASLEDELVLRSEEEQQRAADEQRREAKKGEYNAKAQQAVQQQQAQEEQNQENKQNDANAQYGIVQSGESPQNIAERYGLNEEEFLRLNGMSKDNFYFDPGQQVCIK